MNYFRYALLAATASAETICVSVYGISVCETELTFTVTEWTSVAFDGTANENGSLDEDNLTFVTEYDVGSDIADGGTFQAWYSLSNVGANRDQTLYSIQAYTVNSSREIADPTQAVHDLNFCSDNGFPGAIDAGPEGFSGTTGVAGLLTDATGCDVQVFLAALEDGASGGQYVYTLAIQRETNGREDLEWGTVHTVGLGANVWATGSNDVVTEWAADPFEWTFAYEANSASATMLAAATVCAALLAAF